MFARASANDLKRLAAGTLAGEATLDLVLTSYAGLYRGFKLFANLRPATDDVELWTRFSSDGGVSYDAVAGNYDYAVTGWDGENDVSFGIGSGADTKIILAGAAAAAASIGNAATEGGHFEATLLRPDSAALWSRVFASGYYLSAAATPGARFFSGGGAREAAQDTDAWRILFQSGAITSGTYALFGIR